MKEQNERKNLYLICFYFIEMKMMIIFLPFFSCLLRAAGVVVILCGIQFRYFIKSACNFKLFYGFFI